MTFTAETEVLGNAPGAPPPSGIWGVGPGGAAKTGMEAENRAANMGARQTEALMRTGWGDRWDVFMEFVRIMTVVLGLWVRVAWRLRRPRIDLKGNQGCSGVGSHLGPWALRAEADMLHHPQAFHGGAIGRFDEVGQIACPLVKLGQITCPQGHHVGTQLGWPT